MFCRGAPCNNRFRSPGANPPIYLGTRIYWIWGCCTSVIKEYWSLTAEPAPVSTSR